MAGFDDITPPKGVNWSIPIFKDARTKKLEKLLLDALNTPRESPYKPEYRISGLPLCGLLHAMKIIDHKNGIRKQETLADDFYTDIGTAVHEFYQTLFPKSNIKQEVFGDWKCFECKEIVHTACTTPDSLICPKCRKNEPTVKYEELTVKYRGISGHIDTVFKHPDGTYSLIDFKTTSAYNIQEPKYLPYPKHLHQIESYCFMLKEQYDIDISYYALVYVSRDKGDGGKSLTNTRVIGFDVTKKTLKRRKTQLDQIVYSRGIIRQLLKDPTPELLKELDDNRPCKTIHDWENSKTGMKASFFGNELCPHLESCTAEKKKKYTSAARKLWEMIDE